MADHDVQPTLDELIQTVQNRLPVGTALEQLVVATAYASDLGDLADNLVGHFVSLARHAGASWSQIGDALGVSKQGAQQRFVPRGPVDASDFANRSLFKRFTPRARHAVSAAQEAARELKHVYIGTEHILLGLIAESEGVAARALESLGISGKAVRDAVTAKVSPGEAAPPEHIPFTPRAKTVLDLTMREALKLGHNYIGTEHIALAILSEPEGIAGKALRELGVDYDRLRDREIELLSGYRGKTAG